MSIQELLLFLFRQSLTIVFSWGTHDIVAIENGLRFTVQGYLHKGKVEVVYNEGEDLFAVRLLKPDGSVKRVEEGIYIDCLVEVIDGLVERCENYAQKVKEDYSIIRK